MSIEQKPKIIAIVGQTASGKSDIAVDIALFIKKNLKKFNTNGAEIISADSRQIYKNFDIGANKITKKEMRGVKHWLLDVASPRKRFSVSQYQKFSKKAIEHIIKEKKIPIICGGTGFYIDALIYETQFPKVKPNLKLREQLEKMDTEELFKILKNKDPKRAGNIDSKNKRRLIRAVEINILTGKPIDNLKKESKFKTLWLGLSVKNSVLLKERISKRLEKRLKNGLVEEVKKLHQKYGLSWAKLESFGLEYKFTAQFLENKITKEEMKESIISESVKYAKRQMTWFKRNSSINWTNSKKEILNLTNKFLN